jgi:hypothetical protein
MAFSAEMNNIDPLVLSLLSFGHRMETICQLMLNNGERLMSPQGGGVKLLAQAPHRRTPSRRI